MYAVVTMDAVNAKWRACLCRTSRDVIFVITATAVNLYAMLAGCIHRRYAIENGILTCVLLYTLVPFIYISHTRYGMLLHSLFLVTFCTCVYRMLLKCCFRCYFGGVSWSGIMVPSVHLNATIMPDGDTCPIALFSVLYVYHQLLHTYTPIGRQR